MTKLSFEIGHFGSRTVSLTTESSWILKSFCHQEPKKLTKIKLNIVSSNSHKLTRATRFLILRQLASCFLSQRKPQEILFALRRKTRLSNGENPFNANRLNGVEIAFVCVILTQRRVSIDVIGSAMWVDGDDDAVADAVAITDARRKKMSVKRTWPGTTPFRRRGAPLDSEYAWSKFLWIQSVSVCSSHSNYLVGFRVTWLWLISNLALG